MAEERNIAQDYIDIYLDNESILNNSCGEEVNKHRRTSYDIFNEKGFPTLKDEDFRNTDIQSYFTDNYGLDLSGRTAIKASLQGFKCSVPDIDAYTIYLINGWYYKDNDTSNLPEGVIISSFNEASKKHPEVFARYYNKKASESTDSTVHLNTMLAQDGLFVHIPKGITLDKPIQVINILSSDVPLLSTQRSLFVIDKMAKASLLVCDHALTKINYSANHVREIFVEDNANFDYFLIENQHNKVKQIISSFIHQEKDSNVHSGIITLHNGNTRNNGFVTLNGSNSNCEMYGMAITDKHQHVDNFTTIDHAVPHCTSTELFKNVLDDNSTGAFKGLIIVRPDAQKTEAYQTNKNICLTPHAFIHTKPQLEIYADDVKCSHGATVGQLDEEALFYLKTRGISTKEARMLLMFAFTHEVIEEIKLEPLRERLKTLVEGRLRGETSKCSGCAICE